MQIDTWLIYAFLGAVAAGCTGIFAKVGMTGVDSDLATAIRASIGAIYLISFATLRGKLPHLQSLHWKAITMIVLAGLAGATSWLFQYRALAIGGPVSKVAAIDKLSVPIAVILAVILLKDKLQAVNWMGVALIVLGAYFVAYKPAAGKAAEPPVKPLTTQVSEQAAPK